MIKKSQDFIIDSFMLTASSGYLLLAEILCKDFSLEITFRLVIVKNTKNPMLMIV